MYIDPNTGGVIFQSLVAVLVAASGLLLAYSGKIRGYFAKLRRKARKEDEQE
jgi:hypothetical protein